MNEPISPRKFDAATSRNDRIIWTAGSIARRLDCGEDFVRRTLAHLPGTPIRKKGQCIYVFENDLITFMRDRDTA